MGVKLASKLSPQERDTSRLRPGGKRTLHLGGGQAYLLTLEEEKRPLRWAILAAFVFHVILLVVSFPELTAAPRDETIHRPLYVVQPVRFKPPAPSQTRKVPKKKTRKIPIPDPTPDLPEPILEEDEPVELDLDLDSIGDFLDIPPAPSGGPGGAIAVRGDVRPPVKIVFPQPRYTEEARKARIKGVVILQAIVDATGKVSRIKILKDLPQGLGQSAVDTVKSWEFKPATLKGEPVPVYFNLTISFSLQ